VKFGSALARRVLAGEVPANIFPRKDRVPKARRLGTLRCLNCRRLCDRGKLLCPRCREASHQNNVVERARRKRCDAALASTGLIPREDALSILAKLNPELADRLRRAA
jgi:hypothetical protein